jgi:hypothetical protein
MAQVRKTGPGKVTAKIDSTTEVIRGWLYNFDIAGHNLKLEHTDFLDKIGLLIQTGGAIKVLGLASTTGATSFDQTLSEDREKEVVKYLHTKFGASFLVAKELAFGKNMALAFNTAHLAGGTKDFTEDERWRAVVINAWNRHELPPPPAGSDIPFNNSTWSETLGKTLDRISIALGLIDLIADIAELSSLAAFTGPAGLVLSVIQTILAMPITWATADALAETNGEIQGAADAIQDMADQFGSVADNVPVSQWPAVKVPELHLASNPQPNMFQQAWRNGQSKGRISAVQRVLDLEKNPKTITLPNKKIIKMSGRLWLKVVSKAFGDNAAVEIVIKPVNEELRKRGKPPFPTH